MKNKIIPLQFLEKTCGGYPTVWDGYTRKGKLVYIRYRHGNLSLEISGKQVFGMHYTHTCGGDGVMATGELVYLLKMNSSFRIKQTDDIKGAEW